MTRRSLKVPTVPAKTAKLPTKAASAGNELHFQVSVGLKRILGRDLITNEFVAIFELVKNAFDARAREVHLLFAEDGIVITDDGKGMSRDDLETKWLVVAYSAKRDGTEDEPTYREKIKSTTKYAGSKGVGRFSCDRLGSRLRLQTRRRKDDLVETIDVDWQTFEDTDGRSRFEEVPVAATEEPEFDEHKPLPRFPHGTSLAITGLRETWDRTKLLRLRGALAKLINPFGGLSERFKITVHAPHERTSDSAARKQYVDNPELLTQQLVNGRLKNFIFEDLSGRTTHVESKVSSDGAEIETRLIDRGTLIYAIAEPNPYRHLEASETVCSLFFLNRAAKAAFARRMGVPAVQFGSVFLFRNGFRVFPYGEEGSDAFKIDRRKQQGYARFLGTRDVIGRIDIAGDDEDFREASSRDQGLIETDAVRELLAFFTKHCLLRLERYVVDVSWANKLDLDSEDLSNLQGEIAAASITAVIAKLVDGENVRLLDYAKDFARIIDERSVDFAKSLEHLKTLAEKTNDQNLHVAIAIARERYVAAQHAEAAARAAADKERELREKAEREARKAEHKTKAAEHRLTEEKKRNLFLTSMSSVDVDVAMSLHHQVVIYGVDIIELAGAHHAKIAGGAPLDRADMLWVLEKITQQTQRILAASRFATKANFRLEGEEISADLADYIAEYVRTVCALYAGDGLRLDIVRDPGAYARRFKPIEVAIVIDNLVNNARKAKARHLEVRVTPMPGNELEVTFKDDGRGLDPSINEADRIFEKGFSTTRGSGLGLYFVRQSLESMGAGIRLERNQGKGLAFTVRFAKRSAK